MKIKENWKKWKYGIIYLLLIPSFAMLYTLIPNDFHQSTVIQEGIIKKHDNSIEKWLTETIKKRALFDSAVSKFDTCRVNKSTPMIRKIHAVTPYLQYDPEKKHVESIWANITLLTKCDDGYWHQTLFNINADALYGRNIKLHFTKYIPRILLPKEFEFDQIKSTQKFCGELKTYIENISFNNRMCFLILTDEETLKLNLLREQYNQSLKGKISDYNQFIRMFYLSTVTITTLGYGDIVPISTISRILISIESILGVILIGLFLNSIINSGKSSRK